MKRLVGIVVSGLLALQLNAQNVHEGEKLNQYGRYESTQKAMSALADKEAEAAYYLGIAELELGKLEAAKTAFSKFPDDYRNQAGMARVLFQEGKKEEANKLLLSIVDKARRREWQKFKVAADAITYSNLGNINDAIAWYERALTIESKNADINIALGDAYRKKQLTSGDPNDGGSAMNNYESAVTKGTNNSLAYSRIGSLWYDAMNYELALENYNKAKEADPNNPLPYRDLAYAYYRAGRYENALSNIREYLKLSDNSVNDKIVFSNLLFLTKNYEEADVVLTELVAQNVQIPSLYRALAYSKFELNDIDAAKRNMDVFYATEDVDKITNQDYLYSGKIWLAIAQSDSASASAYLDSASYYFEKSIANDTTADKTTIYRSVADLYKDAKIYAQAGKWYGKTIADNPDAEAIDYFNWGLYTFYGRDYEGAEVAFVKMKEKHPEQGTGFYWHARASAAIDNEAKTGKALQPYLAWLDFEHEGYEHKNSDLMNAYQYIAFYYYNTEKKEEAMKFITKILELDPENNFANQVKNYYESLK